MKTNLMQALVLAGVVAALSPAVRAEARMPSVAGNARGCLDDVGNTFVQCVGDHPWYYAPMCELRYTIDALFCLPAAMGKAALQ